MGQGFICGGCFTFLFPLLFYERLRDRTNRNRDYGYRRRSNSSLSAGGGSKGRDKSINGPQSVWTPHPVRDERKESELNEFHA